MRQIAIVGLSDSTHDKAPYKDPLWELWGLSLWDEEKCFYFDRGFPDAPIKFSHSLNRTQALKTV